MAARPDPQNTETVLRVVEGHAFHQTGEHLPSKALFRSKDGGQKQVGRGVQLTDIAPAPSICNRTGAPPNCR